MAYGILTMEQRISAGGNFNGTLPPGTSVRSDGIEAFPVAATGGLFDFKLCSPYIIRSFELKLGGQTDWVIVKKDLQGTELILCCGTDETDFVTTEGESMIITDRQLLLVRTSGATSALMARVSLQAIG